MEGLKIVGLCVLSAILYGILHDIVTVHICPDYLAVFHPQIFGTKNLWLLALGWGTIATWWMGLILGVLIALAARAGPLPRFPSRKVVKPVIVLLLSCYVLAALSGIWAYSAGPRLVSPAVDIFIPVMDLPEFLVRDPRFLAVYVAHNVSYDAAGLGTLILCPWIVVKRMRSG